MYIVFFVVVATGSDILVHQLSKARSQSPFRKLKGSVQRVAFHPLKPIFFVAVSALASYDVM